MIFRLVVQMVRVMTAGVYPLQDSSILAGAITYKQTEPQQRLTYR